MSGWLLRRQRVRTSTGRRAATRRPSDDDDDDYDDDEERLNNAEIWRARASDVNAGEVD